MIVAGSDIEVAALCSAIVGCGRSFFVEDCLKCLGLDADVAYSHSGVVGTTWPLTDATSAHQYTLWNAPSTTFTFRTLEVATECLAKAWSNSCARAASMMSFVPAEVV